MSACEVNHLSAGSSSAGTLGPSRTAPRRTPAAVWCPRDTCPSSHTHTHTHTHTHSSGQTRHTQIITLMSRLCGVPSGLSETRSSRCPARTCPAGGSQTCVLRAAQTQVNTSSSSNTDLSPLTSLTHRISGCWASSCCASRTETRRSLISWRRTPEGEQTEDCEALRI